MAELEGTTLSVRLRPPRRASKAEPVSIVLGGCKVIVSGRIAAVRECASAGSISPFLTDATERQMRGVYFKASRSLPPSQIAAPPRLGSAAAWPSGETALTPPK